MHYASTTNTEGTCFIIIIQRNITDSIDITTVIIHKKQKLTGGTTCSPPLTLQL